MKTALQTGDVDSPTLAQATRVWWRIGLLSFGGPGAQIALMHKEIVEERPWLTEEQFLNALSFCMLLPGPEAMQLATYAGWRLHGTLGGLVAGLLFVIPGAAVIMLLALIYSIFGEVPLVSALFYGVKAAVLVVVLEALIRVSKKALSKNMHWAIAAFAFLAIFFFSVPYPVIVLGAALIGYVFAIQPEEPSSSEPINLSVRKLASTVITWLTIWWLPIALLALFNAHNILLEVGQFFSTLAVVTFGGAYAVLAYMAQDVVVQFGWLTADEMIDALGLAETTPGPLILVTQFVGYLAGFKTGGILLGLSTALVALWVTFAPCFLWIFSGAPYIDWISSQAKLKNALTAITAAVVGVILNLSIWFALHVLFLEVDKTSYGPLTLWIPNIATIEWLSVGLFALSGFLAFKMHCGIGRVVLVSAITGAAIKLIL